jgi:hypothetical protein
VGRIEGYEAARLLGLGRLRRLAHAGQPNAELVRWRVRAGVISALARARDIGGGPSVTDAELAEIRPREPQAVGRRHDGQELHENVDLLVERRESMSTPALTTAASRPGTPSTSAAAPMRARPSGFASNM